MTTTMTAAKNPLKALGDFGQSVWLDYIRRDLFTTGELKRLIEEDGLRGMTSNPAIFEKAITGSADYDDILNGPGIAGQPAKAVYEKMAIRDIQDAADALMPVYERTKRRDGYVSLEVSPFLARDTQGTLDEARRLWKTVSRSNVMIKVPATNEGIPAIEQLINDGINVNVTLLFSQAYYERVVEAFITGIEKRAARGEDVSKIASVASFFVSRIDSLIDSQIATKLKIEKDAKVQSLLKSVEGKVAIANAKLTYQRYIDLFGGSRWKALSAKGAQTQRVLWASTSTKNPAYRDVIYVEELIGPETVNTIPPATFDAFRDHGRLRKSLTETLDAAKSTMETLEKVGISMKAVTDQLLEDAVRLFSEPFAKLLSIIEAKCNPNAPKGINPQTRKLAGPLETAVAAELAAWQSGGKVKKLWSRDASLWTGADEAKWLGWLSIVDEQLARAQQFKDFAGKVAGDGYSHILLLGMGGSSLCPDLLAATFGKQSGFPELLVLDSTDPAQIKAFESKIDLKKTLFIVSSKSGTTLEPNIFKQYFFDRAKQALGEKEAASRFVAITDPGSKFEQVAKADGFGHIFSGVSSIGGRYSALSDFGMIPAAAMGIDVARFLNQTNDMVKACAASVAAEQNPGVALGVILGVAGKQGRDKVTIAASPKIAALGGWLEQLIAESTGKLGKGLIPVDREKLGPPNLYGSDRVFAYIRMTAAPDSSQDAAIDALEKAGHPVVRIDVNDAYGVGQEFFRWEIATAVAGAILAINPFDQPDVEASKIATKKLTGEFETNGSLPSEKPFADDAGMKFFADETNASALLKSAGSEKSTAAVIKAHLARIKPGDYFAVLGYVEMNAANDAALQSMRHAVRDATHVATVLGFGPRFLHSTGQAYKGGPNSGVILQITCDDAVELPVPGQKYTFGVVKAAQARGDFEVLSQRGRRALRVHLGKDVAAGLAKLTSAIKAALS
jgi:transaldolase/glucose-6-phosphate isomerase